MQARWLVHRGGLRYSWCGMWGLRCRSYLGSFLIAKRARTPIFWDVLTREAVLIDPVLELVDRDLAIVAELGLTLKYTIETHVHADHVTGAGQIRARCGAAIVYPASSQVQGPIP